jgi:hypothetical protein
MFIYNIAVYNINLFICNNKVIILLNIIKFLNFLKFF